MRSSSKSIRTKTCCLAVVALVLWLGGFGCTLCCATGLTDACCIEGPGVAETCSSSLRSASRAASRAATTEHSCCQRAKCKDTDSRTTEISRTAGVKGCSLLPNQAVSLGVVSQITDHSFATSLASDSPLALERTARPADHIIPPPLPLNRGGTYLRTCVFLI